MSTKTLFKVDQGLKILKTKFDWAPRFNQSCNTKCLVSFNFYSNVFIDVFNLN